MECSRYNSRGIGGETSKWQWVNSKLVSFRSGFRIHNSNLHLCLKRWTRLLELEKIYSMCIMGSRKFLNFHALNLASCLISHAFLPSFLLHNGHLSSSKLMISSTYFGSNHLPTHSTHAVPHHPIEDLVQLTWVHHFAAV
ncbi:hypothetical protein AAG906_034396 [Vitis piasezkii]